ncbi:MULTISPECIES: helix-turn-helix domain-containing protein [Thermus]|uniref:Helix-turn-helix domain-containing protein n=1 Tax=Thermus scotoductus TaxID=37636 RepID=A0A430RBY8_THESC|nr:MULTISPECIES: helix-turn-helix domain-containing protein [Thermus]RTH04886.1 hypothetical protein CSW50_01650 [Thermus scotoductus]RTH04887.1 hypothetical protein CSW50_01655 [Thermus scotoductus]BBL82824.1 hypothetical protein TthAA220_16080 [Thermus thermophilus]BBL85123.1 hypothetical protein TthAA229_16040 [Thermus thermophilus]BCP98666.1 hypothetical protein TthHB5002_17690 [Thermus thermophilus]
MLPEELKRKNFLTVKEIAEFLGVSGETIYRLVRRGELKAFVLSGERRTGRVLVDRESFEAFLKEKTLPVEGR